MKRFLGIVLGSLLIVGLLAAAKNAALYFHFYKHGEFGLARVSARVSDEPASATADTTDEPTDDADETSDETTSDETADLTGTWRGEYDEYRGGADVRHVYVFEFATATSGTYEHTRLDLKMFDKRAPVYSWLSLLPYKAPTSADHRGEVRVAPGGYLTFAPGEESAWADTVYSKFATRNDTLFIDSRKAPAPYDDEPIWTPPFSEKPELTRLAFVWTSPI
ncbi:MAG: hypothetical protein GF419_11355 [Ignavibacteriales bacterium]|nr:hypothetical protein [Ignavibacteriales bacterium]